MRALCSVRSKHRALVVRPREEIDLAHWLPQAGPLHPDPAIDAEVRAERDDARAVDRAAGVVEGWHRGWVPPSLLIVRGPVGPTAWPLHPAWVRKLRDQARGAGIAFAFVGWGDWLPISEAASGMGRVGREEALVWRFRADDPDDLPLLSYRVGAHLAGRHLDAVDVLELPEGL